MDRIHTIDEVAALIRRPVNTLRYWRHVGEGPRSFKIGSRIAYLESDLIEWISRQRESV